MSAFESLSPICMTVSIKAIVIPKSLLKYTTLTLSLGKLDLRSCASLATQSTTLLISRKAFWPKYVFSS